MKAFGRYLSKYLVSFSILIIGLIFFNLLVFVWMFYGTVANDYGGLSPQNMVEAASNASEPDGITDEMADRLRSCGIWAMFLDDTGHCLWSVELPSGIPTDYSIQDVAEFARGYLSGYPVFARSRKDGLLVLGYPKESYMKITGNYYPIDVVKNIPLFFSVMLAFDLAALFLAFCVSRKKILCLTEPIISSIQSLSEGEPVSLSISGELSGVADSINRASRILSRQNQARANWISGVSHDIRTPLSMIMGYAVRIAGDKSASSSLKEQARIIQQESIKIKELVQDLNLVSQLEYEMQPLRKEPVRLSRLIRSCAAELLNAGIPDTCTVAVEIAPGAETSVLECDARLIARAVNNLLLNSIRHNPQGCEIKIILEKKADTLLLSVRDNGTGLSPEKLKELREKPHYMESTDERLDLKHGLGLLIVRQVTSAHNGTMEIRNSEGGGCEIILSFPVSALSF